MARSRMTNNASKAPKASLEDVAREAGVSTATVSRVLNATGPVRHATRELVMQAIERLRYTPNLHARTLAGADSRTIGMIVSNVENPFFVDVYRSLEQEAHRLGHEVLIANTGYDPNRLIASVRLMLGRQVSGLVAIVSEMAPPVYSELIKSGIPVVLYDAGSAAPHVVNLRIDYDAGMRQITELLYGAGHRSFAFIGHHTSLAPLSARQQAFLEAMERYGRRVKHQIVTETDAFEGGQRAAHALMNASVRPTAIVCVNDVMAIGVLRALRDRRIRVPDDVSITGFDNVTMAEYVLPALTTVDIPRAEIGRLAVDRILHSPARRSGRNEKNEILITPTLVERASTGKARKGGA